jgi:PAS domain S-box-containing protein
VARVDDAASTVVVRQRLDPHPSSVSRARRLVAAALDDLGRTELVDDAALAVSELVTNALVHAGTPMEVVVCQRNAEVVIEVVDDSPRLPFRRHHADLAGTGRGLRLVEQLTSAWGARQRPPGKAVWILLGPGDATDDGTQATNPAAGSEELAGDLTGDVTGDVIGNVTGDLDADLDALLAAFPDQAGPDSSEQSSEQPSAESSEESSDQSSEPGADLFDVVLLNVPLLLHAAWQMQAESILREYLLVGLGGDDDGVGRELETHAAVHEAMVLLQERIPRPDLGDVPEQLMTYAVEPHVSAERLELSFPVASIDQFDLMQATLDRAMEMEGAGALLTPPTPPEVRAFRRWVCRQVTEQRRGGAPEPWVADVGPELMVDPPPLEWDAGPVATAERPLVAAADTNRIVAVSPAAARLLGYPTPEELVGRRLVEIIPARFRQAHVSGFTLHLFAGRRPLLGHRVTVPALRRDGTEVAIALLVEAVSLPAGRHVFIAELGHPDPPS